MNVAIVEVPSSLLAYYCKPGRGFRCIEGIPENAEFYGAAYDFERDVFQLKFTHSSFQKSYERSAPQHVYFDVQELVTEGDTL